jgi:predicted alpha/beta hydrolase
MNEEVIKIIAEDGYTLSGTLREPSSGFKGFIQINSGTGIPERFYRHFAKYLTKQGYVTVTFDYRGIGKSKPEKLKGFEATNFQWGELDMTAVLNWGIKNYPDLEKIVIGHSMGGQLIGTMKNADKIDRTILIASGTGFWKDMPRSILKIFMPFLWYLYIPFTTTICGYGGAKKIKQGENLPKGVALQWRNWCINMTIGKLISTVKQIPAHLKS